jgi:sugar phosphate isomerase/epimerase
MVGSSLKGAFPFRLGTTSYIVPDDILPNVRFLADRVDDVQLILFESADFSNLPSAAVIRELAAIGKDKDLTYTVHFPLDVFLGASDEEVRLTSVDTCKRIVDLCRPLSPQTFALHFSGDDPHDRGSVPSPDMPGWLDALDRSMGALVAEVEQPRRLCVETLAYPYALIEDVVLAHDAGVCLDVGHLLRWGHDVMAHLKRYADRTHLMHIHGVENGSDHQSLVKLDPALLDASFAVMTPKEGEYRALTVEVFSQADFELSMELLGSRFESRNLKLGNRETGVGEL